MRRSLVLAAALAGCGEEAASSDAGPDADSDVDSDTDADTDVDSDSDADAGPAVCDGLEPETSGNMAMEEELYALVEEARGAGATCGGTAVKPVPSLELVLALRCASRAHARDMAANDFVDHTGSDGSDYRDRFRRFGYFPTAYAGNVIGEAPTARDAFDGWMALENACLLVMDDRYGDFGAGTADGSWAIGFASRE